MDLPKIQGRDALTSPLDLFRRLTNGIYLIGLAHEGKRNAFIAAWVTQVSFDPLLITLSINPGHYSWPLLTGARGFAASILRAGQLDVVRHFGTQSGRDTDKLAGQPWHPSPTGFPVLSTAMAWFDCELEALHPAGDHRLALARVTGGEVLDDAGIPMTWADTGDIDGSAAIYPARFP